MVGIILGVWLNSVGEIVSLLEHCEQCNTEEGLEQWNSSKIKSEYLDMKEGRRHISELEIRIHGNVYLLGV